MYWRRSKVQEEGTANDNLINESTFSVYGYTVNKNHKQRGKCSKTLGIREANTNFSDKCIFENICT